MRSPITVGVLTVSDRSYRGERKDLSGPALCKVIIGQGWVIAAQSIVPDEMEMIREKLEDWVDEKGIALILTTGGTGIALRDVTPEATRFVLEKELPGISQIILRKGMEKTKLAALSRALTGTRKRSLIINLPGNPDGAKECLGFVLELIPHALDVLDGQDHHKKDKFMIPSPACRQNVGSPSRKQVVG